MPCSSSVGTSGSAPRRFGTVTPYNLHAAFLDQRHRLRGLVAQQVDLATQQVGHRRTRTLVRYRGHLGTDGRLEQQPAQVRDRAQARVRQRDHVFVRADVGEQFMEVFGREVLAGEQRHGHVDDLAEILEVLQRIEAQLAVERRRSSHPHVVDEQRVAVGPGARDTRGSDGAARADGVLDDHLLAERPGHRDRHHSSDDLGRAAGRKRYDQGHRPIRAGHGGDGAGQPERKRGGRGGLREQGIGEAHRRLLGCGGLFLARAAVACPATAAGSTRSTALTSPLEDHIIRP